MHNIYHSQTFSSYVYRHAVFAITREITGSDIITKWFIIRAVNNSDNCVFSEKLFIKLLLNISVHVVYAMQQ